MSQVRVATTNYPSEQEELPVDQSPSRPKFVIIAAVAEKNRVIGKEKDLPWHIPEDLKRFKRLTMGHPLIMGRRTFESVVHQFGGPLPGRRMIVLTTQTAFPEFPDVETYPSIEDAVEAVSETELVYIGGGGNVYTHFLPLADRLELTLVEGEYTGDTYFPPFEHLIGPVFSVTSEEKRDGYRFVTYDRIQPMGEE